jgi:D-alanine transaminase
MLAAVGGHLVDEAPHLVRLARALSELRIAPPTSDAALKIVMRDVIRRNDLRDGIVYLQIARGIAPHDDAFPKSVNPVLVVVSPSKKRVDPRIADGGVAVIAIPDIRWQRCDIKSVALLPDVFGKQLAKEAGAYEALQDEARAASEAFLTSPITDLLPIIRVGGDPVGIGAPGPLSRRSRDCYLVHAAAAEGPP